jgi:type IV pilus assembly protein PilV
MNPPAKTRSALGFSLVEAVVALAVLSVGLLGAAGMLLDSLRTHSSALRRLTATHLVRDMADRIRANTSGRAYYDTRTALPASGACVEPEGCDAAQAAAADRARFVAAATAAFAPDDFSATVEFEPATGPATPDRYVIVLSWRSARRASSDSERVALQVLAQSPVAG